MDINLNVPAIEKLIDHTASGIGSIAGPIVARWHAKRDALVSAEIMEIRAEAQSKARALLVSDDAEVTGEVELTDIVEQKIQFQEKKRILNTASVVTQAASLLDGKIVPDIEPDHDWTARFFNHVQDVSSIEMQTLWARVLAGEVERKGSTSLRTLEILRNLDQSTAKLFKDLCSVCIFLTPTHQYVLDARVPSLGSDAAQNSLGDYNLDFGNLNRLNEHGLIISDYNSWMDYQIALVTEVGLTGGEIHCPVRFQGQLWAWTLKPKRPRNEFRISGVALTESGKELSEVIETEPVPKFKEALVRYLQKHGIEMTESDAKSGIHLQ